MAILATLGEIDFEILKNDFYQFKRRRAYRYAEHSRLEGNPTLQQVGGNLDQIDLSIRLLGSEDNDPEEQLRTLTEAAANLEALSFVFGESYGGKWVITKIDENVERVRITNDDEVSLRYIDVKLQLKEFLGVEPPELAAEAGQAAGFAFSLPFGG